MIGWQDGGMAGWRNGRMVGCYRIPAVGCLGWSVGWFRAMLLGACKITSLLVIAIFWSLPSSGRGR